MLRLQKIIAFGKGKVKPQGGTASGVTRLLCHHTLGALWRAFALELASVPWRFLQDLAKQGLARQCCIRWIGSIMLSAQLAIVIAALLAMVWLWLALAAGWCRSPRCCLFGVVYRRDTLLLVGAILCL